MNFPDDPILHWLLRTTLEGGLLIALVLGLRRAFPMLLSPSWRVALWTVVGVKLVLPALLPVGMGFGEILRADAPVPHAVAVQDKELGRPRPVDEAGGEGTPAPWGGRSRVSVSSIVFGVWAGGLVSVIALLLVREVRFRRALAGLRICADRELLSLVRECAAASGVNAPPQVRMLPDGHGPAVSGIIAPALLIPSDWRGRFDRDALRHVILHELEHVRSRDLIWNWVAAFITAVHWFNPLVWLAASRFQSDRELRCDARALEHLAPRDRVAYGRTLLRISEHFSAPPATAGLAPCVRKHPSLRHRLNMIIRPPSSSPALQAFSAAVLAFLVCLSFGSARAQEDPGKDRKPEAERPRDAAALRDGERAKTGPRDGEVPRSGPRDGEVPRSGPRDGEVPRSGPRDGERPRTGPRDEGGRKPEAERGREGARSPEAERPRRDGEQPERTRSRIMQQANGEPIEIRVLGQGGDVSVAGQTMPVNRLRAFLQDYLADKRGQQVIIDADAQTPYGAVTGVLDAARDNGAKNAQIRAQARR